MEKKIISLALTVVFLVILIVIAMQFLNELSVDKENEKNELDQIKTTNGVHNLSEEEKSQIVERLKALGYLS